MFHHRFTQCHVHTDNYTEIYIFFKQEIGIKKEQGKFEYGLNVEYADIYIFHHAMEFT